MATSEMEAFIVRELEEKQKYILELESRIAELEADLSCICGWLDVQEDSIKPYLPDDLFERAKKHLVESEAQRDEQNN